MLAIKWAPLSESMASGTLYLGMISFSKAFTTRPASAVLVGKGPTQPF